MKMKHLVDARGLACPLPVINTKNEIASMKEGETVEVIVDNDIAVQNLTKFANVRNHGVQAQKVSDDEYHVMITVGQVQEDTQEEVCLPQMKNKDLVVLSTNKMGHGNDELGATLMKAFIFALTKQDQLPDTILLYNSGAFLSCEGSDSLDDLKLLEANGVEIMTCGTCLNFYELSEKLAVGSVTNMYDIVEKMETASKIIKP
jgi:selenium metabolism protein YedF